MSDQLQIYQLHEILNTFYIYYSLFFFYLKKQQQPYSLFGVSWTCSLRKLLFRPMIKASFRIFSLTVHVCEIACSVKVTTLHIPGLWFNC